MAVATHLLCLVAVVLAFANVATAQLSTSLPQNTDDDIRIPLSKAPCYTCSYCAAYQIPEVGPVALNLTFTSDTRMNIAPSVMGFNLAGCNGVKYLYDSAAHELVFPRQSTDCISLLVLSYVEPLTSVFGLDGDIKGALGLWLSTFNQCGASKRVMAPQDAPLARPCYPCSYCGSYSNFLI